jgi:lipopolysaccharide export system permease protein
MKIFDRFLLKEFLKYLLAALAFVVLIYFLFDLFQYIDNFINHKTSLWIIGLYYFYLIPAYAGLLLPVGVILSSFLVIGRLTRQRELSALKSAGVNVYRLFLPLLVFASLLVPISFLGNEFVTIPANIKNEDVRIYKIDKRQRPGYQVRNNFFYYGEDGRTFYIRYYESKKGLLRNFVIWEFDANRQIRRRYDVAEAVFERNRWRARDVTEREFRPAEQLTHYNSLVLPLKEKPGDFARRDKDISEMNFIELFNYIKKMQRAGERVTRELVEFHYRFSYPFVGLIVLLLALPLASSLRRGGVMLGLGLGLLFSFSYWGAIQTTKAFGVGGILNPGFAAWLPNIFFGALAIYFLTKVER